MAQSAVVRDYRALEIGRRWAKGLVLLLMPPARHTEDSWRKSGPRPSTFSRSVSVATCSAGRPTRGSPSRCWTPTLPPGAISLTRPTSTPPRGAGADRQGTVGGGQGEG